MAAVDVGRQISARWNPPDAQSRHHCRTMLRIMPINIGNLHVEVWQCAMALEGPQRLRQPDRTRGALCRAVRRHQLLADALRLSLA